MAFKEFLEESIQINYDLVKTIAETAKNKSKFKNNGSVFLKKAALGKDTVFLDMFLANDKSEFINGISHNDPLNFAIGIYSQNDGSYIIEVNRQSYTITPQEKYMAFSSAKIGLRKSKPKDDKALENKLVDMFNKAYTVGEKLYKEGKFSVYEKDVAMKAIETSFK